MYLLFIKPIMDFIVSLIVLILFAPILLSTIIILIIINNDYPFFLQPRPGKNGKIFKVIKFKTMNEKKNANGVLLPPAKRITPIGKFIRSTSIDEMPQLINVLKGDMSLVGPRPLRVEYLSHYSHFQARRHEVKPGITGWAQVNGRNIVEWEDRFKLDVWYVDNQSFWLDMKIIILTICKVIIKDGVNQTEDKTMEPFKGIKLNG